ncbi:MAG: hypothetical protein WCL71_11965 [Deltaproteobacteria bacterium]
MLPESQYFIDALGTGRTSLAEMWQIISRIMTLPHGGQREALMTVLDELRENGLVEFPKSSKLRDKNALPHLPAWANKPQPMKHVSEVSRVIWAPELVFLAEQIIRNDSPWVKIDAWLKKSRGKNMALKPVRERSLDIFGDEKALDRMTGLTPFKQGQINLGTLGCFYVPEPIPWKPGPSGSRSFCGLCVENATTFDTLRRFNGEAGYWAFVAYGRGNNFVSMTDGLVSVIKEYGHDRVQYFGDADLEGIEIAARGAKKLLELGITLELDHRLYNLLVKFGHVVPSKTGGEVSEDASKLLAGAGLSSLSDMFMHDQRIAQEWAGIDALRRTFNI